jgi:hypothetical protein
VSAALWLVWDPEEGCETFATEADALAEAASRIERFMDDGSWDEEVEEVTVARITHTAERVTEHVRPAEMTDDEWYELTGDDFASDRKPGGWWGHYEMASVEEEVPDGSSPISQSDIRRATVQAVRDAKASDRPLTLTPGQRRYIESGFKP